MSWKKEKGSLYKIIWEEIKPYSIQTVKLLILEQLHLPECPFPSWLNILTWSWWRYWIQRNSWSSLWLSLTQMRVSLQLLVLCIWKTTTSVPSGFFPFKNKPSTFCGTTEPALKCRFRFLSFLTIQQVKAHDFTKWNGEMKIWLTAWYYIE